VEEYSTRTGRVVMAVTPRYQGVVNPDGQLICQVLWIDASGRQVASFCASSMAAPGDGVIIDDNGRMTSSTLATPVQGENQFAANALPPIFAPTFGW
jgi:hypothetical protein